MAEDSGPRRSASAKSARDVRGLPATAPDAPCICTLSPQHFRSDSAVHVTPYFPDENFSITTIAPHGLRVIFAGSH